MPPTSHSLTAWFFVLFRVPASQLHSLAVAKGGAAEQGSPSFRSALELRESDDYMR